MDKRNFVKELISRVDFDKQEIAGNEEKLIVIYSLRSNLISGSVIGFLLKDRKLLDKLDEIAMLIDRKYVITLLAEYYDTAVEILQDRIKSNSRLYVSYNVGKLTFPFFVSRFPVESLEEALEVYFPVYNEWENEARGEIILYSDNRPLVVENAVLYVDKIFSKDDLENLTKKEKEKYNEIKQKYPEEAKIVEELM